MLSGYSVALPNYHKANTNSSNPLDFSEFLKAFPRGMGLEDGTGNEPFIHLNTGTQPNKREIIARNIFNGMNDPQYDDDGNPEFVGEQAYNKFIRSGPFYYLRPYQHFEARADGAIVAETRNGRPVEGADIFLTDDYINSGYLGGLPKTPPQPPGPFPANSGDDTPAIAQAPSEPAQQSPGPEVKPAPEQAAPPPAVNAAPVQQTVKSPSQQLWESYQTNVVASANPDKWTAAFCWIQTLTEGNESAVLNLIKDMPQFKFYRQGQAGAELLASSPDNIRAIYTRPQETLAMKLATAMLWEASET